MRRLLTSLAFSSMTPSPQLRPTLRGVIFDMDGTLTVPNVDFAEMYRRCGVSRDDDILAAVESMEPTQAAEALEIIEEMEEEGRQTLRLAPGAIDLGRWLEHHGVPVSLVTRNTARSAEVLLVDHWVPAGGARFDPVISRDSHDDLPPKPHPASLEVIAKRWSIDLPSDGLIMVGDSAANDVAFGRAGGIRTALVGSEGEGGGATREGGSGEAPADFSVSGLWELPRLLYGEFRIDGALGTDVPLKKYGRPEPLTAAALAARGDDVEALVDLPEEERLVVDEAGNTPLIWAADSGSLRVIDFLLSLPGVDVDARGYLGSTALCRASRWGHSEIIRRLVTVGGASMDIPNEKMQYPLHFTAFKKQRGATDTLLELRANTMVLDRKGRTPAEDTSDESIRDAILEARIRACT